MRPFLLLTNDDGIYAPGIRHLWEAVREYADTAIVAPQTEKSGCGLSFTWSTPLRIQSIHWEGTSAWSVNGTPADCVKMACSAILDKRPQMVLSGINEGSNAGRSVLYSGTVGGVIEAVYKNIPGIAFSFCDFEAPPINPVTKRYIFPLVNYFLQHPLPSGTFLNVTFPPKCIEGVKGFRMAIQGKGHWAESPDRRIQPEGQPYYWLGGKWNHCEEDPESEIALLDQGYITAVPIHVGHLTDLAAFKNHEGKIEKIFTT